MITFLHKLITILLESEQKAKSCEVIGLRRMESKGEERAKEREESR